MNTDLLFVTFLRAIELTLTPTWPILTGRLCQLDILNKIYEILGIKGYANFIHYTTNMTICKVA